jgi:large subunit ribosomal protein L25
MSLVLEAKLRDKTGKESCKKLRKNGLIPAVIYGKGKENVFVSLPRGEFEKALHHVGTNKVFTVKVEGKSYEVIVKEVQINPVTREITHVDLQDISGSDKIAVKVPIEFVGIPKGANVGGVLRKAAWNLKILVDPRQIPDSIKIDVSYLDVGDTLVVYKIKDKIPYRILNHDNYLLAGVYK